MTSTGIKKFFIASDHAAFKEKKELVSYLKDKLGNKFEVLDLGTHSESSCHYPDFAKSLCENMKSFSDSKGVLLCGSGIGVSMVANRNSWIRAARCCSVQDAKMTAAHNDANVLCFGSRVSSLQEMKEMIDTWLSTPFEGGRHLERLKLFS